MINERPRKRVILFVDTGDNCRCPMAKEYLKKLLAERNITWVEVESAGVMTPNGLLPTPEAVQMIRDEGWDTMEMEECHRSRPLQAEYIQRADIILGMTPFHVQTAYRKSEAARGKTFLLKEYTGHEGRNVQIPDPMGGTLEIYKKVFGQIKTCLNRLVEMDIITKCPYPVELTQAQPKATVEIEIEEEEKDEAPDEVWRVAKKPKSAPKAAASPKPKPAVTKAVQQKPAASRPAKPATVAKPVAKTKPAAKPRISARPKAKVRPVPKKTKPAAVKVKGRPASKAAPTPKKSKPAPSKPAPKAGKPASRQSKPAPKAPVRTAKPAAAGKPKKAEATGRTAGKAPVSKKSQVAKKPTKSTTKKR